MLLVSGGQTGVDRAALDIAVRLGIPYAGWCPKGGLAEDYSEPPGLRALYPKLLETPSTRFAERTRWNVRDSEATLVLTVGDALERSSGTNVALAYARKLGRPTLVVDVESDAAAATIRAFLDRFRSVNVAGPRESGAPGIYRAAMRVLDVAVGGGA
ncbi:MAG TPA: putative molybdenum carrier protein [Gemmatimonadales bacterium]|nr:putative molybdenum carrier protein [Gemmatimonadales bacterium]